MNGGGTPPLACRAVGVSVQGRNLVRSLDFEARAGEFIAVLGRNGVGKTLTLHTLAGLRPPAAGVVELEGRDITGGRVASGRNASGSFPRSPRIRFPPRCSRPR